MNLKFFSKKIKVSRFTAPNRIFGNNQIMNDLPSLRDYEQKKRRVFTPLEWEYLKKYFGFED